MSFRQIPNKMRTREQAYIVQRDRKSFAPTLYDPSKYDNKREYQARQIKNACVPVTDMTQHACIKPFLNEARSRLNESTSKDRYTSCTKNTRLSRTKSEDNRRAGSLTFSVNRQSPSKRAKSKTIKRCTLSFRPLEYLCNFWKPKRMRARCLG